METNWSWVRANHHRAIAAIALKGATLDPVRLKHMR